MKADLALRALAEAENMEVSDEELDAVVAKMAEQAGHGRRPGARAARPGRRLPAVRSDQRKAKALDGCSTTLSWSTRRGTPFTGTT